MQQARQRVREAAVRYCDDPLNSLWRHCYNIDHLRATFFAMKKSVAAGVDGVTWEAYAENLADLSDWLARGAY